MAKGKLSLDLELYKAQLVVARAEKEKKASKAKSKKKFKENVNPQAEGDEALGRVCPGFSIFEGWKIGICVQYLCPYLAYFRSSSQKLSELIEVDIAMI